MRSAVLILTILLSTQAFAKNEALGHNLSFVATGNIEIPKNKISIPLASEKNLSGKACFLFFQATPFKRTIEPKDIYIVQSAMEDEKDMTINELIHMADAALGADLEIFRKKTLDDAVKYLEVNYGYKATVPSEIMTARFQIQSKQTLRGSAIECLNMNIPEALEFLSENGFLNPSTDF